METNISNIETPNISEPAEMYKLIINELAIRKIKYCHWKSNFHLDNALSGDEDLDLLIAKNDFSEFSNLITNYGFKEATSINDSKQSGVHHFYANDTSTGKLLHIHAFTRILTGDSLIKNYVLPFEDMLLSNLKFNYLIPTPIKEVELIIFLFRNSLKGLSILDIYMMRNSYKTTLEEIEWLMDEINLEIFNDQLDKWFPDIDKNKLLQLINEIKNSQYSFKKFRLMYSINRELRCYKRMSNFNLILMTSRILIRLLFWKYFLKRKYMRLKDGGKIITFIGPQAVGKSTLTREIKDWLGKEFDISSMHVGKPPPTFITAPFRLFLPLLRLLMPSQRSTQVEKEIETSQSRLKNISFIHIFRKIILAYERKVFLQKIAKKVEKRQIVICDRYPSEIIGAVDGPSFRKELINYQSSSLKKNLMNYENSLYKNIRKPDLVISLKLDKDIAVQRSIERNKPGPKDTEYVKFRHEMSAQPDFPHSKLEEIDTSLSIEKTLLSLKELIWRNFQ
tara:strand:+ start:1214 stop:2734 length:1521 start_codon:yes stop_codon:yes gene_type:complete